MVCAPLLSITSLSAQDNVWFLDRGEGNDTCATSSTTQCTTLRATDLRQPEGQSKQVVVTGCPGCCDNPQRIRNRCGRNLSVQSPWKKNPPNWRRLHDTRAINDNCAETPLICTRKWTTAWHHGVRDTSFKHPLAIIRLPRHHGRRTALAGGTYLKRWLSMNTG